RPRHERRDHAAALSHQPLRHDDPDGDPRPRDGRQDAQARDRARGGQARARRAPRGVHLRMMARVRLITAEAVRSLGANLSTTFAATTTVLIGMFMLGLVVGLGSWALSLSDHYKKQLLVKVYFCTDLRCGHEATNQQIDNVRSQLIAMPQVKTLRFISKADALKIEQKQHPDMTRNLPGNPLPNEYEVIPKSGDQVDAIAAQLTQLNESAGVEKICPPPPGSKEAASSSGQSCNRITPRVLSVARYLWL